MHDRVVRLDDALEYFGRACRSTSSSTRPTRLTRRLQKRIEESDPYFQMIHTQWGEGLRRVFAELPNPDWS